ncbi:MAG: transcription-repair coupling factor [Gammaproteobacteria bacterium]|nr:transcription-repair coupling factor [Gammaproteobacteria bacterium]
MLFNAQQLKLPAVGGLYGASMALYIAQYATQSEGVVVVATVDMLNANRLLAELKPLLPDDVPLLDFPDWETLAYDPFSPHADIISSRLKTLYRLPSTHRGVLVIPAISLMQRLAPASFTHQHTLLINVGDIRPRDTLIEQLINSGYRRVNQVYEHGEFSVRGSLLDLFPTGAQTPFRIDYDDDEILELRTFDTETQRSADNIDNITLLPAKEFPTDEDSLGKFRRQYREAFDRFDPAQPIYKEVSEGRMSAGIEYFQPLFFDEMACLADYLPSDGSLLFVGDIHSAMQRAFESLESRYEIHRHDIHRPVLPPSRLYLNEQEALDRYQSLNHHQLWASPPPDQLNLPILETVAGEKYPLQPRAEDPISLLRTFLSRFDGRVLFSAPSPGRRETFIELLQSQRIFVTPVQSLTEFAKGTVQYGMAMLGFEQGVVLKRENLAIITDTQLLGDRAKQASSRRSKRRPAEAIIANLSDLQVGAPVVHMDHGVGRYQGLITLDVGEVKTEFLLLTYAGDDKLYVPIANLHLISRYTGADVDSAPLHKLGAEQWTKAKQKAAQRARDAAAELLAIHAKRAARPGTALPIDEAQYHAFADSFPFEETADQASAIEAVLSDLREAKSMDRIVCGDVGFGKTEVAMRAAFAVVSAGKQVAMLVPTTLLAQQHAQNFRDRFADWPITIKSLSRFQGKKDQNIVIDDLKDGKVDIVIGTHKLLQSSIKFERLGLLIIDEEHRFGVKDKEHFKALRSEVDILTLTATPIPRTLNMSLAGLRDLSIIATPPAARHAIKTFVCEWNEALIREACQRELSRGGQVYVLHNDVASIERMVRDLESLLPGISVAFAHGQMRESELERVMLDFYHQRIQILVATTIIESGIDIPSANTIIINRADKLGLAQLHQLRGRVGRSHHRAYAYMVIPPRSLLSTDAEKRLAAIEQLEDLGVGFMLASHDLEIRGAGEMLGDEQSGQIQQIGFAMYSQLLERAVKAIKSGKLDLDPSDDPDQTEIDLHCAALLPEDYVTDVHTRLVIYKRLSSCEREEDIRDIAVELIDRFGMLPDAAKALLSVHEIRVRASRLGINKIEGNSAFIRVNFDTPTKVDPSRIIQFVQSNADTCSFAGSAAIMVKKPTESALERVEAVQDVLAQLI